MSCSHVDVPWCRQHGTDMDLLLALTQGEQPPQATQLAKATVLLVGAWRGAGRMQDWPVDAATTLMGLSSFLVHSLLQEVGQVSSTKLEVVLAICTISSVSVCLEGFLS